MKLRVVGAGLPRTGTASLRLALQQLLGGPCCHMSALEGHPFKLGPAWDGAIAGKPTDWNALLADNVAAVDWPASMFWQELSDANPHAIVLLSIRDSAESWWQSLNETILPFARLALSPDWTEGRSLLELFERFTGTKDWDHPSTLKTAYDRHNSAVRAAIPKTRLLEWRATDGWAPLCQSLGVPIPSDPFPWTNKRSEWAEDLQKIKP